MEPNNEENEDSNFNQSQDLLSKTQQDENMSNSNNENELKELYNKLSNLPRTELIEIITKKNDELIELNGKKEESKTNLNILVKNLNELVANNSDILYQKEPDPYVIQQLERVCDLRKRDLNTSRKINNTFKIQYKSMSDRVEHLLTPEKINSFESEIDVLRKENLEMNSKIKVLKDNNIENGKKIENLKDTKKYSEKIKSYTEEIKSLGSKKHDYYTKINSNKKSLENVIKEKEVLIKLYNANIKEDSDEMIVSKINFWLDLIKSDLNGTEEEIIQKVESNQSKVMHEIDKNSTKKNVKNPLYLPAIRVQSSNIERAKSFAKLQKEDKNNKRINQTQINMQRQGIFSKYSLLKNKNQNKSQPRYMLSKNKENSSIDDIYQKDELTLDYESTSDNDYRELLSKKNEYVLMIHRLQDTMRDHQKNSNRKNKAITNTVSDNSRKLNLIQHQNLLIKNEIENLEKVYQLTFQQMNLEKKINESKFIKINNNTNMNASINSNNNLDNSNNIQESIIENINNDEKKSIYQNGEFKQSKSNMSFDNYDSYKKITFPNDISKVEKTEDEYPPYQNNNHLSREKRLQEIKYKYLDVEEENNNDKNNVINEEDKNNENENEGNENKNDNKNEDNESKKEQNENNENKNDENENNNNGNENNNEENKSSNEKEGEEEKV